MSDNIKNIISGLFTTQNKLSKGLNQYTVEQVWRDTFGTVISQYTHRVTFSKGTLTVYITSSPLKQELTLTREKVIEKMNNNLKYNKVETLLIR